MTFTVDGSAPPCVAFTGITSPARPIIWGGRAKELAVVGGGGGGGGGGGTVTAAALPPPPRPSAPAVPPLAPLGDDIAVDTVDAPAVFDAAGGGGLLLDGGSALEGVGRS